MKKLKIGVVGATGMVGKTFMNILDERAFPIEELRLFASENSAGKTMKCAGRDWPVQPLSDRGFDGLDLVFFSSGDDISRDWAPKAVQAGAYAVDNSAAFRMNNEIHLSVPEVNAPELKAHKKAAIIANPNCSTIQLVVALKPLAEKFGLREVRVASYQAVSGAGQAGHDELIAQTKDYENQNHQPQTFQKPILFNVIPQIGSLGEGGFFTEELKIMKETRKIMGLPKLKISAFTVRVPALNAHSEAVWVELDREVTHDEFVAALKGGEGLIVEDDPKSSVYPTPRQVSGKNPVYVGRIHRDLENPHLWMMWVVADNLRKGAAFNGVQIAERIFDIPARA